MERRSARSRALDLVDVSRFSQEEETHARHVLRSLCVTSQWDRHCDVISSLFVGCGHCKAAKPKFQQAAIEIQGQKKQAFAAVDCTADGDQSLCVDEGVEGYPTLKYYNYGKRSIRYEGDRETNAFVNFLNNPDETGGKPPPEPEWKDEVGSAVHHLTDETFDAFLDEHPSALVMFYAPCERGGPLSMLRLICYFEGCGHCKAMKPAFSQVAGELDEVTLSPFLI